MNNCFIVKMFENTSYCNTIEQFEVYITISSIPKLCGPLGPLNWAVFNAVVCEHSLGMAALLVSLRESLHDNLKEVSLKCLDLPILRSGSMHQFFGSAFHISSSVLSACITGGLNWDHTDSRLAC